VSAPQPPGIPEPSPTHAAPVPEPEEEKQPSTWQPVLYLKLAVLLFVIGYSIAFAVENSRQIDIDFIFGTAKVRLIWEILLLLAIGILGGILLSQLHRHRRRAQIAQKSGKTRYSRSDVGDRDEAVGKPG
jgi:uncharacterized integral membrane protein